MCMLILGKKWNKRPAMCKLFFCFFFLCEKTCLPIWRDEIEASMKYEPGGHTCPVVEEFTHLWFKVHARSVRVMAPSLQCTPSNSPGTVGYTCYLALLVPFSLVFGPIEITNLWNRFNRIRIIIGEFGCAQIRTSSSCSSERKKI